MKKVFANVSRRVTALLLATALVLTGMLQVSVTETQAATITINKAAGWFETAYAEWAPVSGATGYKVYVKAAGAADSTYVRVDDELIRKYSNYYRVDAVGLKAGNYVLKIEAVTGSSSVSAVTGTIAVQAHDRAGFAFVNGTSSGAYNDDGTLRSNAVVIYLTEQNKNTVSLDMYWQSTKAMEKVTGIQNILTAYQKGNEKRPLDIRVIGTITDPTVLVSGDMLIKGNGDTKRLNVGITVEGIGEDATFNGFGIRLANASNIEVRNMGVMLVDSGEGDNYTLQQSCDHVWVHNCDSFYGMAGGDADQAKGDGALDCKKSTYVTFSYNHFFDNGKCNLLGLSEGTTEGLYITYHHNWYDHSDSRHPRIRFYTTHVYNNYYDGNAKYGIGSTLGSSVFAESNYFRNCKYPMLTSMQGSDIFTGGTTRGKEGTFSGEAGGTIKAYGNIMVGTYTFIPYGASSYTLGGKTQSYNLSGTTSTKDFDAVVVTNKSDKVASSITSYLGGNTYNNFDQSMPYKYTADAAADVPAVVTSKAGRINQGDFKWTFDNSVDDTSYSVNQALMSALKSYKTKLVSVGGGVSNDSTGGNSGSGGEQSSTQASTQGTTGSTQGSGSTTTPTNDDYTYNVTKSGVAGNAAYTIANAKTTSIDTTYAGVTLTTGIKMESSTTITLKAPSAGKLVMVFAPAASKTVKVDGTAVNIPSNGVLEVEVKNAGNVVIGKGTTDTFLGMLIFTASGSGSTTQPSSQAHTHSWDNGTVTKAATCIATGVMTYKCSGCSETKTETINKTAHNYSSTYTVDVAATATTAGSESRHCTTSGCTATTDSRVIPATGSTQPAESVTISFNAVGLTANDKDTVADTTVGNGYIGVVGEIVYKVSKDSAGNYTTDVTGIELDKNGTEGFKVKVSGTATLKVTAASTGSGKTSSIAVLNASGTAVNEKNGVSSVTGGSSNKVEFVYELTTGEYTIVAPASSSYALRVIAINGTGNFVAYEQKQDTHTHSYGEFVETTKATCTTDGVKTATCSCGDKKTETITATGHSYNTGVVTTAATCIATGVKTYTCSKCNDTKTETINKTAHNYSSTYTVDVAATATTAGSESRHCTTAGCSATTDSREIPATGTPANAKNGIYGDGNGNYYYYVNGVIDTSYIGLKQNDGTWWFIEEGKVATDFTGFFENSAGRWYVKNGKIDTTFTGLALYDGKWLCVRNGKYYPEYTGMVQNGGAWWYVENGELNTGFSGVYTNDGGTWFVKNGKIATEATGIFTANDKFYYVTTGKVAVDYTGIVKANDAFWYVENGILNTNYTGIFTNETGSWYIVGGKLNTAATTVTIDGKTYKLNGGKVVG